MAKDKEVKDKTPEVIVEDTAEYEEGRRARIEGRPNGDNPYTIQKGFNDGRFRWFQGWYGEKIKHLLE